MPNMNRSLSLPLVVAASLLVSGCGSIPDRDSVASVQVWKVFGNPDPPGRSLRPSELAALRAAGVSEGEISAGRVVGVRCAVMTDGSWASLAILPPDVRAAEGTTLRVKVVDPGDNDRLGISEFVELPQQVPSIGQAYRFVPNWRELGRRNNFERIELPAGLRDKYLIVQGSYVLKCDARLG